MTFMRTVEHHYLPQKENIAYSPLGVRGLIEQAQTKNGGDLEVIFKDKHRYRTLVEMYHATFLALALYKKYGPEYKFNIVEGQNPPDLYFIQADGSGALPVEVMELFKPDGGFQGYPELAMHVWKTKGHMQYEKCHLLLASRLSAREFSITKFIAETQKLRWSFERIWLSLYTKEANCWTFFEVFPSGAYNDSSSIDFRLNEDKKLWY